MKRIGLLVLVVALFCLSGCGGSTKTVTVTEGTETTTTVTETGGSSGPSEIEEFCSSETWNELEVLQAEMEAAENGSAARKSEIGEQIGDLVEKSPPGAWCRAQAIGNVKGYLSDGSSETLATLKQLQKIEQRHELTTADVTRIEGE